VAVTSLKFMGIDPGASGAVVLIEQTGHAEAAHIYRMPGEDVTLVRLFRYLQPRTLVATIEAQHAFPNFKKMPDGTTRVQNQTGQVKFIGHYEFMRGLLIGMEYSVEPVQPATWQRYLHCLTRGDKSVSLAKARELFPNVSVTNWNADALLIAEYGRLKALGRLPEPLKTSRVENKRVMVEDDF
jgi:hypothetical protein